MNNLLEDVPLLKNLIIHIIADQLLQVFTESELLQVFPESDEIDEIAMIFLDELEADPNMGVEWQILKNQVFHRLKQLVGEIARAEAEDNMEALRNELDSLGSTTHRGLIWQEVKDFFSNTPGAWQALNTIGGWYALNTPEGWQSFKDLMSNPEA